MNKMILPRHEEIEESVRPKTNIEELFRSAKSRNTYLKVCAPMVRYSKLEFRTLVRKYGVDLCFTPMIMADSFRLSQKARLNEFSTSTGDTPVIAQFAAKDTSDYLSVAEMIYPYVDGIDLNCGCPQKWAIATGYGSALLNDPELVKDLTSTIKRNISSNFSVSVKLRVQKPLSQTINLCRQLEKCGVTFLTVHGRTATQKMKDPSNVEFLKEIQKSLSIPLIANGDVRTLDGADNLYSAIKCDGVMTARGILSNPALFAGHTLTPMECIQDWVNLIYAAGDNVTFQCFHHHLTFMMEKMMRRRTRVEFNNFTRKDQVYDFLQRNFEIVPQCLDLVDFDYDQIICEYDESRHRARIEECRVNKDELSYDSTTTQGQYYLSQANNDDDICDCGLDYMESNLFDT